MDIIVTQESDIFIFALRGKLDAVSAPQLEEMLVQWFEKSGKKLIFNLQDLEYISSVGLRIFLATAKKMKKCEGKLCMASLQKKVKDVFTISGFISLIPEFNNLGEAQDAMR
jgi:anti-sigma B factor antagonist